MEARKPLVGGEEWQNVSEREIKDVAQALSDPLRLAILSILGEGPIKQIELVSAVSRVMGKNYGSAHLRYHLKLLEKAGLVSSLPDPANPRGKVLYRSADFRLQLRPREKPSLQRWVPRSAEEFAAGLREVLGRK